MSEYEPKQKHIDFESATEILIKEDGKMIMKRCFERIYEMIECKSYMKNEDVPENKEIFIYGFKYIKTDKIDTYFLIGCESEVLYGNDKLFNFWTNRCINKEKETRNFKITGWCCLTLVKRNNFIKIHSIVCS